MTILAPPDPPPLVAGAKLTVETIGRLLEPAFATGRERPVSTTIDLRRVQFVTPFALVALATQIEAAYDQGGSVRLLCPAQPATLRYLAASGFFYHVRSRADVSGGEGYLDRSPTTAATVLPLTRIGGRTDIDRAYYDVRDRVDEMSQGGAWLLQFRNLVIELCGNIFRHAEVEVGYVVAQRYDGRGGPFIELAIGDAGLGVIETLAPSHPELLQLAPGAALRKAVQEELSSGLDDHGGNGFYGLHKVARERRGRFVMRSGSARVSARRGSASLVGSTRRDSLPGTQIMVTVDCDR